MGYEPLIKYISSKKLVGVHLRMNLSQNKTYDLWKSFMPRREEIANRVSEDLYSLQQYDSPTYFQQFSFDTEFAKWACVEVSKDEYVPEGMEVLNLQGGKYAVFIHKGGHKMAPATFQYIFQSWLPQSGYKLDHRPHFELLGKKYKGDDPDSEEEIYIPVKEN